MSAHEGSKWQEAHEADARRRRDAHTEQMIDDARGPVETPEIGGPFDDKPDDPPTLRVSLEGESAEAYEEFRLAAKALGEHQQQAEAIGTRYRAALQRLSVAASGVK